MLKRFKDDSFQETLRKAGSSPKKMNEKYQSQMSDATIQALLKTKISKLKKECNEEVMEQ